MNTSFGETLRAAREAKGLTTSQIASKTRMLVQIVEEMENEDFHRIAAPIYGRGFVKLYAECVDLDPLPLVKEFMDIYEGRRAPIVRTREVPVQAPPPAPEPPPVVAPPAPEPPPVAEPVPPAPAPEEPPVVPPPPIVNPFDPPAAPEPVMEPAPEPIPEPPPVAVPPPAPVATTTDPIPVQETPPSVRGLELFEASAPARPQEQATAEPGAPADRAPASRTADIFTDSPYLAPENSFGGEGPSAADRFRKSLSSVSHGVIQSVREIPRSVWRITLLVIVSLVLLALLAWGCLKLYQATSITPGLPAQATSEPGAADDNKEPNDFSALKDSKNPKDAKASKETVAEPGRAVAPRPPRTARGAVPTECRFPPGPVHLSSRTARGTVPSESAAGLATSAKDTNAANSKPEPGKRPPLRSTGQKVPTLYAD